MKASNLALVILASLILGSLHAEAQPERTKNFLFKQCDEDVLVLRVDPDRLRQIVEPDFSLMLEEGKAAIAIMVQDCSQYWVDGEDLGENQHVHILAMVEGRGDTRPVVGTAQTRPTMTWFSLFAGSTNARGREARMASRTSPEPIEAVSLDPARWPRGGKVALRPGSSFSWSVPTASPTKQVLGVNHDIYVRDSNGDLVYKQVQATGNLVAVPSPGTLDVAAATDLAGVIGAGRYPVLVYTLFPIWARATLGAELPE